MVSNNVKSLEVNEEKSMAKQDEYENTIRDLTSRLSQAESRAEFAERAVQKLIKEVDRLEGKELNRLIVLADNSVDLLTVTRSQCNRSFFSFQTNCRMNARSTRPSRTRW